MKIGIVVPFSWSFWGGVPEHADHQARALIDLGHDVRVIMGHDPDCMQWIRRFREAPAIGADGEPGRGRREVGRRRRG